MTYPIWLRRIQLMALFGVALAFTLPGQTLAEELPNETAAVTDQSPAAELALWNKIKESNNPDEYLDYLNRFPNGMFFDPAKARYEEMTGRTYTPAPVAIPSQSIETPKTVEPVETEAVQPKLKPKKAQVAPKQKARKRVAAKKTRKIAVKTKKRLANASVKPKLKKKTSAPARRAVAKIVKPKKAKSVSNRRICSAASPGPGCPIIKRSTPIIPVRSGGGNGGGGGSGGGGGWGG